MAEIDGHHVSIKQSIDINIQYVAVYAAPWKKHGIQYGPVRYTRRDTMVGTPIYRIKITWKRDRKPATIIDLFPTEPLISKEQRRKATNR